MSFYGTFASVYNATVEKETRIRRLIWETCSESMRRHLQPEDSVRNQFRKIGEVCKEGEFLSMERVQQQYEESLQFPTQSPKSLDSHVKKWEDAMEEALQAELPEVANSRHWLRRLLKAVYPIAPDWCTFAMGKWEDDDELTYRTVGNSLRRHWTLRELVRSSNSTRVSKGVTFATFSDECSNEHQTTGETADGRSSSEEGVFSTKNEQPRRTSRKKQGASDSGRSTEMKRGRSLSPPGGNYQGKAACKLCGSRFHNHLRCWYAIPERCPEDWVPRKETKDRVQQTLEENPAIKQEVDRARKQYLAQKAEKDC
jgi:hypothetical protein